VTGALTGRALLDIAIPKDAPGNWQVGQFDVTEDGSIGTG